MKKEVFWSMGFQLMTSNIAPQKKKVKNFIKFGRKYLPAATMKISNFFRVKTFILVLLGTRKTFMGKCMVEKKKSFEV